MLSRRDFCIFSSNSSFVLVFLPSIQHQHESPFRAYLQLSLEDVEHKLAHHLVRVIEHLPDQHLRPPTHGHNLLVYVPRPQRTLVVT